MDDPSLCTTLERLHVAVLEEGEQVHTVSCDHHRGTPLVDVSLVDAAKRAHPSCHCMKPGPAAASIATPHLVGGADEVWYWTRAPLLVAWMVEAHGTTPTPRASNRHFARTDMAVQWRDDAQQRVWDAAVTQVAAALAGQLGPPRHLHHAMASARVAVTPEMVARLVAGGLPAPVAKECVTRLRAPGSQRASLEKSGLPVQWDALAEMVTAETSRTSAELWQRIGDGNALLLWPGAHQPASLPRRVLDHVLQPIAGTKLWRGPRALVAEIASSDYPPLPEVEGLVVDDVGDDHAREAWEALGDVPVARHMMQSTLQRWRTAVAAVRRPAPVTAPASRAPRRSDEPRR